MGRIYKRVGKKNKILYQSSNGKAGLYPKWIKTCSEIFVSQNNERFYQPFMNNPLVSIITANYNKDQYLPDMLQSIKRQLYTNIEHIIVDDGSNDNSHSLLKEYGEKNSYTKIIINQDNCGCVAKLRNQAVRVSSGKYIMNIDSDDILYSDAISTLVETAETKNLDLIYGSMIYIDKYGSPYKPSKLVGSKYQFGYLIKKMFIPFPRMYKREIFNLTSGYNENLNNADDWDLYLQIEEKTNQIDWTGARPLFAYRQVGSSLSNSTNKKKLQYERNIVRKTALERRHAKTILVIGKSIDKGLYVDLVKNGNNVCSYSINGIQNIELNQYIWGNPYKNKKKYQYKIISELNKIWMLIKQSPIDKIIFFEERSYLLMSLLIIIFPFSKLYILFSDLFVNQNKIR